MSTSKRTAATRERMRRYRAGLRARGLRPIQIWVPDVRSPQFAAEASRQWRLIAQSAGEADDLAFVDSLGDETLASIEAAERRRQ